MTYESFSFFLFFPAVAALYYAVPHRRQWIWLLAASYFFYLCFNPRYFVFLAATTLSTYAAGLLMAQAAARREKRAWAALCICVNLGLLLVFKYLNLFAQLFAQTAGLFGFSFSAAHFDLLLPAGISFYTFQAVSYLIDVYRGDVRPQRHLGKYALFVSFFPQITSGPIGKAKETLRQFDEVHIFDATQVKTGLLRMLWGYFQKMVVADRLGQLVDTVYSSPQKYGGFASLLAVLFYSFQIYCDFAGYSEISISMGQVLGFRLPANFDRPYLAGSVQEFWRRWHISLSTWFRDYLYFPLGGSRCSLFRRCLNVVAVFAVCGLWHGASVTFLVWGLLHGAYQVAGLLSRRLRAAVRRKLGIPEGAARYRAVQAGVTFLLVTFAWIFFRAGTLSDAAAVIGGLFRYDPAALWNGSLLNLGLSGPEMGAAAAGLLTVAAVDLAGCKERMFRRVLRLRAPARWAVYLTAVMVLIIFGIYGPEYNAAQFIYSQF